MSKVKILVINKNKEYEFTISDKGELKASSKINKLKYDENVILLDWLITFQIKLIEKLLHF